MIFSLFDPLLDARDDPVVILRPGQGENPGEVGFAKEPQVGQAVRAAIRFLAGRDPADVLDERGLGPASLGLRLAARRDDLRVLGVGEARAAFFLCGGFAHLLC